MNPSKSVSMLLGAINLLVASSPALANQVAPMTKHEQSIEQLNVASLKSIESSWIRVPGACKARGFNASAATLAKKEISAQIQNIYSSFEV